MGTIVTYDISEGHTEVKSECLSLGFEDCLQIQSGEWKRLPNTTLRHADDNRATVLGNFRWAVSIAGRKINRPIIVEKIYLLQEGPGRLESDQECRGPKSR